ncbi:MAG TPA: alpha/beta hydrolase [Bryobacteraceae bacterium]|nr:alpha/beta hydrolase [Bryobacteraceae bacterium]
MMRAMLFVLPLLAGAATPESKTTYTYKTAGGCAIQADVYRTSSASRGPAVLWIHGGALIMGHRGGIPGAQLSRYLEAGFTVVSIDYRLAPETKLPEILEDVTDAYGWLREKGPDLFGIDPSRIAVVGHSAGGYLTLVSGYRFHPRPRALVSFYGYGDIVGDWYSRPDPFYSRQPAVSKDAAFASVGTKAISGAPGPNDRDRFYLYCRQQGLWPNLVAGLDPREQPKAFDAFCPLRNVTRDYPPAMLLHGDQDTDVPFTQSELMAKELERNGVEHEFVRIPGGGHGFDRDMSDPRAADAFHRVMAFLETHLR